MPRTISIFIVMHHVIHGFFSSEFFWKALTVLSGNSRKALTAIIPSRNV
jgi:hypothetical protein